MKEACWQDCIDNNSSLKISSDYAKAKSLIETAKGRTIFLDKNEMKD
jgi:hypothetical protein